jgi:hypothetical protein
MNMTKLETYIGIGLVVIAIVAFLFVFVSDLPSNSQVNQQAQTLPTIPDNMFASSNPLVSKLNSLSIPTGTPVVISPTSIGRGNVFQSY